MNEWRVVDGRITDVPSYMRTVSSDVCIQRCHWQPLSVHLWAYCPHATHDVNDVISKGWPQHRGLRPLLFSNCSVGSFYVPQERDNFKCCDTGPTVFRPYQRRLDSALFSVIWRPWVLVRRGFEPTTSHSGDRRSPNWANQATVIPYFARATPYFARAIPHFTRAIPYFALAIPYFARAIPYFARATPYFTCGIPWQCLTCKGLEFDLLQIKLISNFALYIWKK